MLSLALRKLETFGSIANEDKDRLIRILTVDAQEFPARFDIISEGDNPEGAHLLEEGLACRYKVLNNGKRQIVAFLIPGDFCDLHSHLMKSTDHNIATLVPSNISTIPAAHVDEIMALSSLFKPMMISTLIDEATFREWITNIGQRPAAQRLAHLVCELHTRHERVGLANGGSFELPITQVDLADALGLSIVHTNRSVRDLKHIMTMKSKSVHIPDIKQLENYCNFNPRYLRLGQ